MSETFSTHYTRSFQSFINQLKNAPHYEDVKAREWVIRAQRGDGQAANQLATSCFAYIFSFAQEYLHKTGEEDIMEFISSANEGLSRAIYLYKSDNAASFLTFAKYYMRTSILTGMEENRLIPRSHRAIEGEKRARKFCETFLSANGSAPTIDMVCEGAHVSRTYVETAHESQYGSRTDMRSIDDWEVLNRADEICEPYDSFTSELYSKLNTLDSRHRHVICAYYGIDMERRKQTEIAEEMHLTAGRVSQLREEGLRELQHKCAA